ncbi:hypothetical protein HN51_017142 [Arachis hypogaea]
MVVVGRVDMPLSMVVVMLPAQWESFRRRQLQRLRLHSPTDDDSNNGCGFFNLDPFLKLVLLLQMLVSYPYPSYLDPHPFLFCAGVAGAALDFTLGKVVVEVTDVTELETNETELSHIVELDLVYHSMNSNMLGVVAVRYK